MRRRARGRADPEPPVATACRTRDARTGSRCSAGSACCSPRSRSRCTSWRWSPAAWPPTPTGCPGATCTSSRSPAPSSSPCSTLLLRRFALAVDGPDRARVVVLPLLMVAVDLALRAGRAAHRGALLARGWSSTWCPRSSRPARSRSAASARCSTCSRSARPASTTGYLARVPALASLDRMSYRMHAFAFPVWTFAVLITGPIWAHQAWSSYWNWDPKEVWAFITWVVYAAYLHARTTAGWKGRNAAVPGAGRALATLWFNFIGINFFSTHQPALVRRGRPGCRRRAPGTRDRHRVRRRCRPDAGACCLRSRSRRKSGSSSGRDRAARLRRRPWARGPASWRRRTMEPRRWMTRTTR